MKSILIFTVALLGTCSISAQNFQHDFTQSLSQAQESEKKILMIFSGSDWCKPCIQLKSTILSQAEFIQFSEKHLVLLELDFPYKKKNKLSEEQRIHNEELAEQYNPEGSFPKLVLLDANQQMIGQLPFQTNQSTQELIHQIESLIAKN